MGCSSSRGDSKKVLTLTEAKQVVKMSPVAALSMTQSEHSVSQTTVYKGDLIMALPEPQPTRVIWTPELWLQRFKEIVTAILGISIVIFTLILAWQAFGVLRTGDAFDEKRMSAAKDILLLLLGLSGVVIGYYFGRVPADARAAQAQEQANTAISQAEQISAEVQSVADDIDNLMITTSDAGGGVGGTVARGAAPASTGMNTNELRRLRDKLRHIKR
jgi:hypothetical protein